MRAASSVSPVDGLDPSEAGAALEDPAFLTTQLLTYIGNKRALLGEIGEALVRVKRRLARPRLRVWDAFAGSGVVSRFFKGHASFLSSNDLEEYAALVGRCYLSNRSAVDLDGLRDVVQYLNDGVDRPMPAGFVEELYAPRDEAKITASDRVFYTKRNARRLDNYRRLIDTVPDEFRDLCLGPLLGAASVHANTAGVFKGFYKDRATGIGRFGGSHSDALTRITGEIVLRPPVLSRFECDIEVTQQDANSAARTVHDLDLAYFDPPYNQHPYGSNYFMLNLLARYGRPAQVSDVSGIPVGWTRSAYNVRARAHARLSDLFGSVDARFLLVSFNDEGFVTTTEMEQLLRSLGRVETMQIRYNTFRGSRNLRRRRLHVTEYLFLVERRL